MKIKQCLQCLYKQFLLYEGASSSILEGGAAQSKHIPQLEDLRKYRIGASADTRLVPQFRRKKMKDF